MERPGRIQGRRHESPASPEVCHHRRAVDVELGGEFGDRYSRRESSDQSVDLGRSQPSLILNSSLVAIRAKTATYGGIFGGLNAWTREFRV